MRLRWLPRTAIVTVVLAAVALVLPMAAIETTCRGQPLRPAAPADVVSVDIKDPGYRHPEAGGYLSYPEWAIAYAYQDLAATMRHDDPDAFDYRTSVTGYWSNLCSLNRIAAARGGGFDQAAMLAVIGASFSAEMLVKGAYERTIGRFTAWVRGRDLTQEDLFAQYVAEDSAAFLLHHPWPDYPFGARLRTLWTTVPFTTDCPLRAMERRVALTLEWGVDETLAALGRELLPPRPTYVESVVRGLDDADLTADKHIVLVRDLGPNLSLIRTPRRGGFTEAVRFLAGRHRQIIEIAGNRDVLVTALVPDDGGLDLLGARPVFEDAIQSRPGWHRLGLDVRVETLTDLVRSLQAHRAVFEHVYPG